MGDQPVLPDYEGACTCNVMSPLVEDPDRVPDWFPDGVVGADQVVLWVLDGLGWDQMQARLNVLKEKYDGSAGTLDGYIQEQTPSGKVVWSWSSADHIPLSDTAPRWWKRLLGNPHPNLEGHDQIDIFHLNTVEPYGKDQYVISSRHTDAVFGISKKTGEVLWKFGGVKTPESLKIEGDDPHADYPIAGNHDARMTGNILSVHDNATNIEGRQPRMVRYRIDLKNRTATYVGQGIDPKVTKSHCCGGVRPFGTGWLVAWGNNPYVSAFTSKDALAFRMKVPIPVYRAVPVPPQVSEADLNAAMDRMEPSIPQSKVPVNPPRVFDK